MAIILLGSDGIFPAGALRSRLQAEFTGWRWTCGEDDDGARDRIMPWRASQLICGRANRGPNSSDDAPLFLEVRWIAGPLGASGTPMHSSHVKIGAPTTDDPHFADHLTALIASAILDGQPGHGLVQMLPGTNWLGATDAARLTQIVAGGEALTVAAGLGIPEPAAPQASGSELASLPFDDLLPAQRSATLGVDTLALAEVERSFAHVFAEDHSLAPLRDLLPQPAAPAFLNEHPGPARLPTIVALFDRAPILDWSRLTEGLRAVDPEGMWHANANAAQGPATGGTAKSVDAALTIAFHDSTLPAYLIEPALDRSFWVPAGPSLSALRRHRTMVTITADLNCAAAGPDATRAAAKAMTMALAVLAKSGPLAGVYNAATSAIFTADAIDRLVAPLGAGEVPIQLFIWTAFHSTQTDAIALSTTGLIPFVGLEVEAWNAPGDLAYIGAKLNGVLRYLLLKGPAIGHGDTIGEDEGDQTTRCFLTDSRATRPYASGKIPALILEFAGPQGSSPRPEAPRSASQALRPQAPPPSASFGRRAPGGFGRKGL